MERFPFRCGSSPQHNGGEEKEHQVRQAQHRWIQDVSEHRNGMTLAHTCNDEAQESRDEQHDPPGITRRSTQDRDDDDAPHHEIADLKEGFLFVASVF